MRRDSSTGQCAWWVLGLGPFPALGQLEALGIDGDMENAGLLLSVLVQFYDGSG